MAIKKLGNGSKHKMRSPTPDDIALGTRLRLRRVEQKMSQDELGFKLGVSFQQVQKYEKASIASAPPGCSRSPKALEVPVTFFMTTTRDIGSQQPSFP